MSCVTVKGEGDNGKEKGGSTLYALSLLLPDGSANVCICNGQRSSEILCDNYNEAVRREDQLCLDSLWLQERCFYSVY
jgi:hypothetical protein